MARYCPAIATNCIERECAHFVTKELRSWSNSCPNIRCSDTCKRTLTTKVMGGCGLGGDMVLTETHTLDLVGDTECGLTWEAVFEKYGDGKGD